MTDVLGRDPLHAAGALGIQGYVHLRLAATLVEAHLGVGDFVTGGDLGLVEQYRTVVLGLVGKNFSARRRYPGLGSPAQASELALMLRAGSLAAPVTIVEERTIGPSLGQANINAGLKSMVLGMALVLLFMLFWYKLFGLFANIALLGNLVIIVGVMSLVPGATMTLPGIAGIVLTVGMAVDANVLINERIKENLRAGIRPREAIEEGYSRAFITILDSNLTTMIVAVILFAMGSGSVQGFAVTLFIGIVSSMFTAIVGTRALVEMVYGRGGRTPAKLSI